MPMDRIRLIVCSFLLILPVVVHVGCETAVDPYTGTAPPYTIWGVMNSEADTQKVRVFSISGQPGISRPDDLDATVSSVDLTTGTRTEWTHRKVLFEGGDQGHVFWAASRVEPGRAYRLDVVRSDGATSSAQVTVPLPVEVNLETSEDRSDIPVQIIGSAPNLLGVEVRYEAGNLPPANPWPPEKGIHPNVLHFVDISYQDDLVETEDGWSFDIRMQRDYDLVRDEYERNCLVTEGAPDISLRRVELHFVAADSAWNPPGGRFDPEILVEPGAMSNVENGFGFLGAGQVVRVRWTPPREVRYRLGYKDEPPCNSTAQPIPACMDAPIPCQGENPESLWEIYFR
jgi:hypothetical protein